MKVGKLLDKSSKISYAEITKTLLGFDIETCPCCKTGKMSIVEQFRANSSPVYNQTIAKKSSLLLNEQPISCWFCYWQAYSFIILSVCFIFSPILNK